MEKRKTNREYESEKIHGKKKYRIRKQLEQDGDKEVKEYKHVAYGVTFKNGITTIGIQDADKGKELEK